MLWKHSSLWETSVISAVVNHFDCKCSCLKENNVPVAFILPGRWQDGVESLRIESTASFHSIYFSADWRLA